MHSFDYDKELDLLSKTAAEAIDAPSSANWEKMQRILDKELPQEKKRRGGIIWWIAPAILVAGLGYFWLNHTSLNNISVPNSKETSKSNTTTKSTVEGIESIKTTELKSDKTADQNNLIVAKQSTSTNKIKTLKKSENKIIINSSTKTNTATFVMKDEKSSEKTFNNPSVKEETSQKNQATSKSSNTDQITATTSEKTSTEQTNANQSVVINNNKSQHKNQGLFFGLTGGFDASTVKFKYASNVGYNIGGVVGFRFNDHWSMQSGAIYTQKNYKLRGQDFHAPKGSWASYHEIETVDGYCKMWDIPIIATYHFTGNKNGNSFISIGTSSYFMKHEDYNYVYDYNNQYYTRSSSINSSDQHLFALLHISAGIERPISKSITSIIEPYAKIPLAGVGYGSIQMSSFGLNFSVQYRQPKK